VIKTKITEMFGVETPIVMGGMTGVGYGPLVAAVANAGALGFIVAHLFPTADALKAEIGRPTVEVIPAGNDGRGPVSAILERFGPLVPSSRGVAVRLEAGEAGLAEVVRALDADNLHVEHLELHSPSLDDVFLAKTGRSLEGHGAE